MNEIRSEIMGTMARNTQRNKSTLNVLAKQKADAEKLKRLPPRPLNPNKCSDLGHAIQYRHNVRRDIAHMVAGISKMRLEKPRALLPPSDDDPEPFEYSPEDIAAAQRYFDSQIEEVRQRNAEINAHTRLYDQWDRRVVALGGDSERREAPENVINGVAYFGAARYLPEYTDKMAARLASATSATRGIGQKTGRSTESDVLLSEEGKKSGDVDAAYADSEDDMLESTKDADDEDYAAFLAGGGDFGVVGGGVEKSLAPLLCLGASCNGLPSLPSHVAPHSPEAILLQLSGQVRIGPLNSGVCKGCGGNAATRDLWKSEMAKMDARAAELQPKPQENITLPYDLAELLAIEPFTADTYAAFVLAEKKKELRDRMASARRNATPGAAS